MSEATVASRGVRRLTGRQLRAELLVEGGFSESSGEQTPFRVAVRRLYNLALLSRQVEDLQAIADEWVQLRRAHPRRALWVRTSRRTIPIPLPSRRAGRIVITTPH